MNKVIVVEFVNEQGHTVHVSTYSDERTARKEVASTYSISKYTATGPTTGFSTPVWDRDLPGHTVRYNNSIINEGC